MKRRISAAVLLIAASGLLAYALTHLRSSSQKPSLVVYCAAGLKKPVEEIAAKYESELGVKVELQYGGSGTLLSQIRVAKTGDIFIAADDGVLADARKQDVIREVFPLALQHPVIGVLKGNPKGLHSIDDLLKPDVKVALPNPDAASIGRVSKSLLGQKWDALAAHASVMKPTVTEIAADVSLQAVDAALIWNSTAPAFKALEIVEMPELKEHRERASAAVLASSQKPTEAIKFARYMAAPDKGGAVFAQHGFDLAGGDPWTEKPEMVLYSGGVNRPAIEKLVQQFADREGATITTVFNGCGILCASMKAMKDTSNPKFPDAYYACDVCFVPPVAEHFPEAVLLTKTEIIIAVPKGNAKNVKTLADLAQPGLKLGICNAQQSTLGFMTQAILKASNMQESILKNVAVQVPTGDFLVNQMRAGSLDAAIVYLTNVQQVREHFDVIHLPAAYAKAVQPFAVRVDSKHRELSQRLLGYLKSHKESFEAAGFVWTGEETPVPSDKLDIPSWLKQP